MSEPFLAQVMIFGGTFAPRGWAFCNGQLMPINQNGALFSLLGTTYGGNGTTTFALPDLRGRVPIGFGQGSGLSNYQLGQTAGQETVALTTAQLPAHSHLVNADSTNGTAASPSGANLAQTNTGTRASASTYTPGAPANPVQLSAGTIAPQGGNQGHTNIQPSVAVNYIIALQGIFPTRP